MSNSVHAIRSSPVVVEMIHFKKFMSEARKVIYGKDHELKLAFTVLLARGHLLIEDIPGVGKTTFVSCLARLLGLKMNRIQFTNDLLPVDILGANIFDPKANEFRFIRGPIFAEIVLGDELNRASPKSQSAFLQAMEERTVSIDGQSHPLPDPFFIIATQNPQSQIGTYPLPESQLDRFLMRISLGYPDRSAETELLKGGNPRDRLVDLQPVFSRDQLTSLQKVVGNVHASDAIIQYVQEILIQARSQNQPLSPRAGLLLMQAARAWAFINGRDYIIPEDIQDVAHHVLTHRLPRANHSTIEKLIAEIPVP